MNLQLVHPPTAEPTPERTPTPEREQPSKSFDLAYKQWARSEMRYLSRAEREVVNAIYTYADAQGVAWPSVEALAEDLALNPSTIKRARKRLIDAGYLQVINPGGGAGYSTKVKITLQRTSEKGAQLKINPAEKGVQPTTKRGAADDKKGCTSAPLRYQEETKEETTLPTPEQEQQKTQGELNRITPVMVGDFRKWEESRGQGRLFAETEASRRTQAVGRWLSGRGVPPERIRVWISTYGLFRCVEAMLEWDTRVKEIKTNYAAAAGYWLKNNHPLNPKIEVRVKRVKQLEIEQHREAARAAEEQERLAQLKAEREQSQAAVERMTEDEIDFYVNQVREKTTGPRRRSVMGGDFESNVILRIEVVRRFLEDERHALFVKGVK